MANRYFQMERSGETAEIVIYGDVTSWPWVESDVSSWTLSKALASLPEDVTDVTVRINSYGGEVAEGIAIYNALKAHPARVTTVCDGFACSVASVIFMAGDERVMNEASLLMIHNAWTFASGDANGLRKQADDLDVITSLSKSIYLAATDLDEDELTEWMDRETFIDVDTAYEHGFCTCVESIGSDRASQSAAITVRDMVMAAFQANGDEDDEPDEPDPPELDEPEVDEPEPDPDGEEDEDEDEDEPKRKQSALERFARAIAIQ